MSVIPRADMLHLDDFCRLLPNGVRATRWGPVDFKVWEGDRLSGQPVTVECKGRLSRRGWFGAARRWHLELHYAPGTSIVGVLQAFTDRWGPPRVDESDGWRDYRSGQVGVRRWAARVYEWPR